MGIQRKSDENVFNVVISPVPADGLAPLGARPSAGTVVAKFAPVYIPKGLISWWDPRQWHIQTTYNLLMSGYCIVSYQKAAELIANLAMHMARNGNLIPIKAFINSKWSSL